MTVEDKITCQAEKVHDFVENLDLGMSLHMGLEVNIGLHDKVYNTLRDNIWQIEDTIEAHVKTR